jgi:hypothetical protein
VDTLCGSAPLSCRRHLAGCNPIVAVHVLRLAQRGEVFEVPPDASKESEQRTKQGGR